MATERPSPFALEDAAAYGAWRDARLAAAPTRLEQLLVEVKDPRALRPAEREALLERVRCANMAIYASARSGQADREIPRRLGAQLGLLSLDRHHLADDDGVSSLTVAAAGHHAEFIPYTDRAIKWHTDGYYNSRERQIRGLILHCVRAAASGGENRLLDHEIAYILLREADPEHIRALSREDAMVIPPRLDADGVARARQSGPVFSTDGRGQLHMRYTARRVSVQWRGDEATRAAVAALEEMLERGTAWTLSGRLEAGMGLVCNNVLHDRSAFRDEAQAPRLLYRARYYERVSGAAPPIQDPR